MASPTSHWSQRFNILALTKLSVIISSLLILATVPPLTIASEEKSCIEIKEDFDLRNIARHDNVLLIIHDTGDDSQRTQICERFKNTPKERIVAQKEKTGRSTVFAYLQIKDQSYDTDGQLQDGGRGLATTLGVKTFPQFAFIEGGMDGKAKYSSHITFYSGSTDDDSLMTNRDKFIHKHVGYRIGVDVYNIIFFDSIASKFISYGDCTGVDRVKQKALALLIRFSTLFSYSEPFSSIGKLYNKAFEKSLQNGMGYASSQIERIERMLKKQNDLSEEKVHEMVRNVVLYYAQNSWIHICLMKRLLTPNLNQNQKRAVLKAFAEPRELTDDDNKQIAIHVLLHLGLIVATVLLFVLPSDSGKEEEGEEPVNEVPVIAKVVEDENGKGKKKNQ